ncbi:MAG TPA: porin [Balneolales bacterium]|nr:porin [Balneolales bacterium]
MSRIKTIILLTFILIAGSSVRVLAQQKIDWNGYFQYRFSENYANQNDFSIRRAKLWMKGQLPFESNKWGFKLQSIFFNKQNFKLRLQDAFINYKSGKFTINAGQFVPDFSLQRKQPDYKIPLTERANVVNALIPTAQTMARDIGLEVQYNGSLGGISAGFFNGNGANTLSEKKNFLIINRGFLHFKSQSDDLQVGYSFSYRKDNQLTFSKIFGNAVTFSGNDFRYGFDARLQLPKFELQSEFLEALLSSKTAWGYYALTDYEFIPKNLFILSIEQLHDLNPATNDNPYYIAGYSYKLKNYDIKFTLDNRFQFTKTETHSLTTLQIQYFFNQ